MYTIQYNEYNLYNTNLCIKKAMSIAIHDFFCTIGEKLASEIDTVPKPLLSGKLLMKIAVLSSNSAQLQ